MRDQWSMYAGSPLLLLFIGLCLSTNLQAQEDRLRGQLITKDSGEPLPFANVLNETTGEVVITDTLGFFVIDASATDSLKISFVGYQPLNVLASVISEGPVIMKPLTTLLKEIEVQTQRSPSVEQFDQIRSGYQSISKEVIFELPTLAGEPDFVKVVTMLPGASKGNEGSNDFFIRGGDADQNLVLLDGATVYNTGHLFGFLSVFNPSAVGEVNTMTGGFPAEYGGRLSSIIDVKSKPIAKDEFNLEGGVGLISSRISAEIPLVENKLAARIAGRRTYADQLLKVLGTENDIPYYFYDVNFNLDWQPNDRTKLYYSFYVGDDVLDYNGTRGRNNDPSGSSFVIGNKIQTLLIQKEARNFVSETNFHWTQFDYSIFNYFQDSRLNVEAGIADIGVTQKISKPISDAYELHFGFSGIHRIVNNNLIQVEGELAEVIANSDQEQVGVFETGIFGEVEFSRNKLQGILGGRVSNALIPGTDYWQFEPRLSLRYAINDQLAVKASLTRMSQYLQRVSSTSFALPTDLWYPVDQDIRPQISDQVTLGINRLFEKSGVVVGLEGYYKQMRNLVEFREGSSIVVNPDFKETLLQGDGDSYGMEFLVRKDNGRYRGWFSYTLSWTQREFDELNEGREFPARYDRRHNASLVNNYQINDRWAVSLIWEFISGARFTPIIGYYAVPNAAETGADLVPIYPDRNSVRLADTHRLDISFILKGKERLGRKWRGDWHFSIYNVYNRATPISIDIIYDEASDSYSYEQPGLLGLLPSITYNFYF